MHIYLLLKEYQKNNPRLLYLLDDHINVYDGEIMDYSSSYNIELSDNTMTVHMFIFNGKECLFFDERCLDEYTKGISDDKLFINCIDDLQSMFTRDSGKSWRRHDNTNSNSVIGVTLSSEDKNSNEKFEFIEIE